MPTKVFLVDKATKQKYRLNGSIPSTELPNNANLQQNFSEHACLSAPQLPPKVDLRPSMTAVEDQSFIGSW
jgi:hypothetical protein